MKLIVTTDTEKPTAGSAGQAWRYAPALLLLALFAVHPATAATVRDDFDTRVYSNNDGTVNWSGNWVEIDGQGGGPTGGNVWITNGDELRRGSQNDG